MDSDAAGTTHPPSAMRVSKRVRANSSNENTGDSGKKKAKDSPKNVSIKIPSGDHLSVTSSAPSVSNSNNPNIAVFLQSTCVSILYI